MNPALGLLITGLAVAVVCGTALLVATWVHNRRRCERHCTITYKHGPEFSVREHHDGSMDIIIPPDMTARQLVDRVRPIAEAHGYRMETVPEFEARRGKEKGWHVT